MRFFSVLDLVGIAVDENYPWQDTLFIAQGVSMIGKDAYEKCKRTITVSYRKKLDFNAFRFIGDGAYIGENAYADESYGAIITKKEKGFDLSVSQECNEWLVILLQISLLEIGYTLLHAAALEKDGEVLLLPSWGGVGKTATVCRFVREHGWKLLGDDLVILGKERILPFLKPFVIYPYHKNLFPELFAAGKNHTVKNIAVSSWMSKIIPCVKRMLRPFPMILAFLRKHNPQSMRVPPQRIFRKDQLSSGGIVKKIVWLERSKKTGIDFIACSEELLASKATGVTCVELFSARLEAVFHMCGAGMIGFNDVFIRMQDILKQAFNKKECFLLSIPVTVPIEEVGTTIYQNTAG